jgi:hypothetical protein
MNGSLKKKASVSRPVVALEGKLSQLGYLAVPGAPLKSFEGVENVYISENSQGLGCPDNALSSTASLRSSGSMKCLTLS